MKRKLLCSVWAGCLSLGMLSAQEFHLQPTPQVYETLQDSIVLPDAYRFSADAKGRLLMPFVCSVRCCLTIRRRLIFELPWA